MHRLILGDCLAVLPTLDKQSVNLICVDLPYGITQNKWDVVIPMKPLWECFEHVLAENGCIVMTAAQPFASMLIMSNIEWFKYDIIWQKTIASGQLSVNTRPLRTHEHILIFYKNFGTYNEQKTHGNAPYKISRKANYKNENYGKQKESSKESDGSRHATSVLTISNPRIKDGHPTQKPVTLLQYIIKTYSNKNDTVLDCCMGAASAGVASLHLDRQFIGIENNSEYFEIAKKNMISAYSEKYIINDWETMITIEDFSSVHTP